MTGNEFHGIRQEMLDGSGRDHNRHSRFWIIVGIILIVIIIAVSAMKYSNMQTVGDNGLRDAYEWCAAENPSFTHEDCVSYAVSAVSCERNMR